MISGKHQAPTVKQQPLGRRPASVLQFPPSEDFVGMLEHHSAGCRQRRAALA